MTNPSLSNLVNAPHSDLDDSPANAHVDQSQVIAIEAGNGVVGQFPTSNTNPIQDAFDALSGGTTRGTVLLPPGDFTSGAASISNQRFLTISGVGRGPTNITLKGNEDADLININNEGDGQGFLQIGNMRLEGNKGNNTAGTALRIKQDAAENRLTFENMLIQGFADRGVYITGNDDPDGIYYMNNIQVLSCDSDGWKIHDKDTDGNHGFADLNMTATRADSCGNHGYDIREVSSGNAEIFAYNNSENGLEAGRIIGVKFLCHLTSNDIGVNAVHADGDPNDKEYITDCAFRGKFVANSSWDINITGTQQENNTVHIWDKPATCQFSGSLKNLWAWGPVRRSTSNLNYSQCRGLFVNGWGQTDKDPREGDNYNYNGKDFPGVAVTRNDVNRHPIYMMTGEGSPKWIEIPDFADPKDVSSDTTLNVWEIVYSDATSSARTQTLPNNPRDGVQCIVSERGDGSNATTVTANTNDSILGGDVSLGSTGDTAYLTYENGNSEWTAVVG